MSITAGHLPPLPDAPVDAALAPRVGQYEGAFDEVRWGYPKGWLKGQVQRALTRKRWFQVLVSDGRLQLVAAIVDQGYGGYGWAWLVDGATGDTLAHHGGLGAPLTTLVVGPKAGEGADASMRLPWAQLRLRRGRGQSAFRLTGRWPGFDVDLHLDTAGTPPAVTAIGVSPEGGPGLTQRHGALRVDGVVEAKGLRHTFERGLASLEYTNAFFGHAVAWQSAVGLGVDLGGSPIAFALSDAPHVGGAADAAAWVSKSLRAASAPTFELGADPGRDRWTIRTAEGTELRFSPHGHRVDAVNVGVVKTRVVRAVGRFDGHVTSADGIEAAVESVYGLCEARDLEVVAARRVAWLLAVAALLAACRGGKGAGDAGDGATARVPPGTVVTLGPGDDLAAALATAGERAREADQRVYVELYASWSEPALAIHRSMADPRMREAFSRTFVLRVDIDHHRDELEALGYPTSSVPLVVAAGPDGRAGDRHLTSADLTAPTPAAMAPIFERFFHGE